MLRRLSFEGALTYVRATDTWATDTGERLEASLLRYAFGGVDGGLEENFEALDRNAVLRAKAL